MGGSKELEWRGNLNRDKGTRIESLTSRCILLGFITGDNRRIQHYILIGFRLLFNLNIR
jgi:hypothetical protein